MAGSLRMRNHSHNNWRENPNAYGTSGGLIQTIHLPVTLFLWVKWRATASVNSRVVVNHCWTNSSSLKALWYECNTPLKMPLLRVWSIVIASVVIELAWLKERRKKKKKKIDDLAVKRLTDVVLQRWSLATLTLLLLMKTPENDWYGLPKFMTASRAEFWTYDFIRVICGRHFFPMPSLHMEYYRTPWYISLLRTLQNLGWLDVV